MTRPGEQPESSATSRRQTIARIIDLDLMAAGAR
jgi:hypothetical protein